MLNQFQPKAKKERKVKKQKQKDSDQIPASMMSKIDAIIRQRVESELEKERQQDGKPENSARVSEPHPGADSIAPYDMAAYRQN